MSTTTMEFFINCNTSSLAPLTGGLTQEQVIHLYRRLGFGASIQTINTGVGQTADALVDALIAEAIAKPLLPEPEWGLWNNSNYPEDDNEARTIRRAQAQEWRLAYANTMIAGNLRDRMSFFWSNHFVTELDIYNCNAFLYEYTNCLQRNAIGNFRTFASEIGLTNAMLYYLDGVFNNGNNPNENYARELYELFCLGDGNGYTEEDIIETAKALTGYVERGELGCEAVLFNPERHDEGAKTIFGQTGNWGYDDVIDILFTQRPNEIAEFICRKLYEFFVHPDSDAGNAKTIITGLAQTFTANNFDIAPVLAQLFKSQHFFDEDAFGVIIKSPFDVYFNFIKETGFAYTDTTIEAAINYSELLSQTLFDPVDVAGWQRNRSWVNTNFMIGRWLTMESILEMYFLEDEEQFRNYGLEVTGVDGTNSNNPDIISRTIIDLILPKGLLTQADYDIAFLAFRSDTDPTYYEGGADESWTLATWANAPTQVYLLLKHLSRQPEFQLK